MTEKRTDGFHNLETVFYPIDLSDMLEILPGEGKPGEYTFLNTGIDVRCEAEKNLIIRAYLLLARIYKLPALQIHLHKVIPFGAGLGGGSADAAFMLKALNEYFYLHLTEQELIKYASSLGSDCAFFVRDVPAFACGKGDILEEIGLSLSGYRIILVKPDFGVSTPEAYAGIVPRKAGIDLHSLAALPVEEWKGKVGNDFETTVFQKYPFIGKIKQQLYDAGAIYASMTGSGSAVYGLFDKNWEGKLEMDDVEVFNG